MGPDLGARAAQGGGRAQLKGEREPAKGQGAQVGGVGAQASGALDEGAPVGGGAPHGLNPSAQTARLYLLENPRRYQHLPRLREGLQRRRVSSQLFDQRPRPLSSKAFQQIAPSCSSIHAPIDDV